MELIAPAAYRASVTAALHGHRRIASQAKLANLVYCGVYGSAVESDKLLAQHLSSLKLDGCDAALSYHAMRVSADAYGALLRSFLLTASRTAAATLQCPSSSCQADYGADDYWAPHVTSCVSGPGNLPMRRHNRTVDFARDLCRLAHFSPDAAEPRDLHTYRCPCSKTGTFSHDAFIEHKKTCHQASSTALHSSGPDVRYHRGAQTFVADVTIVEMGRASVAGKTALELFKEKSDVKHELYDKLCHDAGATLQIWPATSMGHLGSEFVEFIGSVAAASYSSKKRLCMATSAFIAHQTAYARLIRERELGIAPPPAKREHGDLGAGLAVLDFGNLNEVRPLIAELGVSSEQFAAILTKAIFDVRLQEQSERTAAQNRRSQQALEAQAVDDAAPASPARRSAAEETERRSVFDAIKIADEDAQIAQTFFERTTNARLALELATDMARLDLEYAEVSQLNIHGNICHAIEAVQAETRNIDVRSSNLDAQIVESHRLTAEYERRSTVLKQQYDASAAQLEATRRRDQSLLEHEEQRRSDALEVFTRQQAALRDHNARARQAVTALQAQKDRLQAHVEEARRTASRNAAASPAYHIPRPSTDFSNLHSESNSPAAQDPYRHLHEHELQKQQRRLHEQQQQQPSPQPSTPQRPVNTAKERLNLRVQQLREGGRQPGNSRSPSSASATPRETPRGMSTSPSSSPAELSQVPGWTGQQPTIGEAGSQVALDLGSGRISATSSASSTRDEASATPRPGIAATPAAPRKPSSSSSTPASAQTSQQSHATKTPSTSARLDQIATGALDNNNNNNDAGNSDELSDEQLEAELRRLPAYAKVYRNGRHARPAGGAPQRR
jgi:hypothetical protein